MNKKILLGLGATVAVIASIAAFSAYEAHVINVTAHIENALAVTPEHIHFGTVFPQEYLERSFTINLSDSFMLEDRVDDVEYVIKQKPKCKADHPDNPVQYAPVDYATHECPVGYTAMLSLCEYLSKLPQDDEASDLGFPSYYVEDGNGDYCVTPDPIHASGRLAKSDPDISDTWIVDLKVPPVDGYVGQDWPADCPVVELNDRDYGCDLWIEVTNISLPGDNGICEEKPDVMQVLDESGSIDAGELVVLKAAAKAFIAALAPSVDGAHMGQTSFETTGSLDHVLSYNVTTLNTAVDAVGSTGFTNLKEGILLASAELASTNDRPDATSPDFMVIITDGAPNRPTDEATAKAAAIVAANAADAVNTTIYVVGVGTTAPTSAWLRDNIATTPGHYYDASDWPSLEAILTGLATCK